MSDEMPRGARGRVLAAGFVGNVLEWYDFAVYGFFAPVIGRLFFPSDDPATSLIASFGAFAAGFLMRPVGAVLFGHIGDRYGRKRALTLSVAMMAIPTFLVGVLPTHAQIGPAAAVAMVLLRMVQGLSVGGEYTGSIVFLVEHAPPHRRAFYGSFSLVGANGGILLGSAVGSLITGSLTDAQLASWGWRLPFLAGIVIALVGLFIRRSIPEQPVVESEGRSPVREALARYRKPLLQAAGLNLMTAVVFYTAFVYLPTWFTQAGETESEALEINTISMAVLGVAVPFVALLADRYGRRPFLLLGSAGVALGCFPLLWTMHHHDFWLILLGQVSLALLLALYVAVVPTVLTELFPRSIRVTSASLSYNLPFALFGGTSPMLAAWLVKTTGNPLSIGWPIVVVSVVGFLVTLTLHETRHAELHT